MKTSNLFAWCGVTLANAIGVVLGSIVLWASANEANAISINQVSTSIDLTAQSADFQIIYNGVPNFLAVDSAGRPADQFRIYIVSPFVSLPGNTCVECAFSGAADPWLTETLGVINLSHGFGPTFGTLSFSQSSNILEFSAPFSVLNAPDGNFLYLLVAFNFGDESRVAFSGFSGGVAQPVDPFSVAPVPAALPLFATGLGMMGLLGWRRKRRAGVAAD